MMTDAMQFRTAPHCHEGMLGCRPTANRWVRRHVRLWCVMASAFAMATAHAADEFQMTRSAVAGGGVIASTGGDFELSGTVGQADAGVMTGGVLELTGGFWFPVASGDCNTDGGVDLADFASLHPCVSRSGRRCRPWLRVFRC